MKRGDGVNKSKVCGVKSPVRCQSDSFHCTVFQWDSGYALVYRYFIYLKSATVLQSIREALHCVSV